jgi:hypothetical protein
VGQVDEAQEAQDRLELSPEAVDAADEDPGQTDRARSVMLGTEGCKNQVAARVTARSDPGVAVTGDLAGALAASEPAA